MKLYNKKKAFTIAEIMVVLLILTIIFAAMAPLITKRRLMSTSSRYMVWSWANGSYSQGPMDAYFYSGDSDYTGEAFFGITPENKGAVNSSFLPLSRVVIRSGAVTSTNAVQRQMQFRYGRSNTTDKGSFAGTLFSNGKNILFGGEYPFKSVNANNIEARNNLAIGYLSMSNIKSGKENTAVGAGALKNIVSAANNTGIGYNAGSMITGDNNTFVGSYAGERISSGYRNTVIGYAAGQGGTSSEASDNVFIGAYAGRSITNGTRNVAIGYNALGKLTSGSYNVAIGYNALANLQSGSYNVALGYNACLNVKGSYKTCIGANSGPQTNSTAERYLKTSLETDKVQRTYIGGRPDDFYGGDAVLEIHNLNTNNNKLFNSPGRKTNVTTVINGNLIVRGRTYLTVGSNLYGLHHNNVHGSGGRGETVLGSYRGAGKCATNQNTYSFGTACPNLTRTSSDRRLKNIGKLYSAGLDEINQLKVYNFTYKNDKTKRPQVGVMAQELQKVFPNAVVVGDNGYLKIRWDEMFFASINAIKELDAKIVNLIKRTTDVETQIAQLEKENSNLKMEVANLTTRVEKLKSKN